MGKDLSAEEVRAPTAEGAASGRPIPRVQSCIDVVRNGTEAVAQRAAGEGKAVPVERFAKTAAWIFDLDNTLYPAECNLFAQVDQRMGEFIAGYLGVPFAEARALQKNYYRKFGTTLAGLMTVHGLKPEAFLDFVHDIDVSMVLPAPDLRAALNRLPGRKYIFTNGSRRHAENVAGQLGIVDCFDDVFDIGAAAYVPKPDLAAYESFLKAHAVRADAAAMFEDLPHNLEAPHRLGMVTVLVHSCYFDHPVQHEIAGWARPPEHVHHMTENLTEFLREVHGWLASPASKSMRGLSV